MAIRLTESRLRRIIREEINEMASVRGATLRRDPDTGKWVPSEVSDIEGPGAAQALDAAASKSERMAYWKRPRRTTADPMAGYLGEEPDDPNEMAGYDAGYAKGLADGRAGK